LTLRSVPELIVAASGVEDQLAVAAGSEGTQPDDEQQVSEKSPIDMPVITASRAHQAYEAEIAAQPRAARTDGSRSFLRQLLGIVGGGVVGLVAGYFILLWIGGPEKDFLELGERLPAWAVPNAFQQEPEPVLRREELEQALAEMLRDNSEQLWRDPAAGREGLPPEPSLAEPLAPAAEPVVAVVDPPQIGTAALEAALQAAADVRLSLAAGELTDPTLRPLKADAYRDFAALAEAVTFAKPTSGREAEHDQLLRRADQLLRETLVSERIVGQLGRLADDWIETSERGSSGLIAAGNVIGSHLGIAGQRGILLELAGTPRALAVVAEQAIDAPAGARVVVVGALLDEPRQRIRGYTGSADQVVWAGMVLQ
jgi:hypothetical protein